MNTGRRWSRRSRISAGKSVAAGFLRLWIRTLLDLRSGQASSGWTWLKEGSAEGFLVGGCLESMQHLRATPYWPDLDGAILFLETSEEKPEPERVDGILMDYENMGVFERIRGLLFGRPMYYELEEREQLREVILERTAGYDFPVVSSTWTSAIPRRCSPSR